MQLFYKKIGIGQPLIILHGLFGQSDNWNTLGRLFSEKGFEVYLVDLRNHGNSPHSDEWSYQAMSDDILELINDLGLHQSTILLGHSMGGKVAMRFAIEHPQLVEKLIVVDIAPKFHLPDNKVVVNALNNIDLKKIKNRKEAESVLSNYISDNANKQFLLKNIYWKENIDDSTGSGTIEWKFNKEVLLKQMGKISDAIVSDVSCEVPTLFIRGSLSNYILDEDITLIYELFTNVKLDTIFGAGHWVHADKPKEFFESVIAFIN